MVQGTNYICTKFDGLVFTKASVHEQMPRLISPKKGLLWKGSLDMEKVIGFSLFANGNLTFVCVKKCLLSCYLGGQEQC